MFCRLQVIDFYPEIRYNKKQIGVSVMTKKMTEQKKYQDILLQIDETFSRMKGIRPLSESEVRYYYDEFSISSAHNSNAIEGNTFTYDETRLLLKEGITSNARSFREHEEIIGYKKAFDYLYSAVKDNTKISEEFIKKLHGYVLRGDEGAGQYRKIQNYVGDMFNVKYTPCPPSEVPEKMRIYVEELREDLERNAKIKEQDDPEWAELFYNLAKHHIEFEKIHPFVDGNGRTGRLLLIYEMIYIGLLPVDIRYEERARYYSALAAYEDKAKYSARSESKFEPMAKLLAESELASMQAWLHTFDHN